MLCATCGVEHGSGPSAELPEVCAVCADDRQWVPPTGQEWTTVREQRESGAQILVRELEPGLWSLPVSQGPGIGQHAKVLCTPEGNLMVDVPAHIDQQAVDAVAGLGGLAGIIASHPGSVVVHWTAPDGEGVLLSGDTVGVARSGDWATFMRSFPNHLPLSGAVALRIAHHLERYRYSRLYDNFGGVLGTPGRGQDAAEVVRRSAQRHADWAEGRNDHLT